MSKYVLSIAVVLWVLVVVQGFRVSFRVVVLAVLVMAVLVAVLVITAQLSADGRLARAPTRALVPIAGGSILLVCATLFSTLFFKIPFDLQSVANGPLSAGSPPVHPVYNVIFSPTKEQRLATLVDRQETTVRFFIGPPNSSNAIPESKWTVNSQLLSDTSNVPLTITMTCAFCDRSSVYKRVATYFGEQRRSSEVVFNFIPLRNLTNSGLASLVFQVTSHGIQYDNVAVDVEVSDSHTSAEPTSGNARENIVMPANTVQPSWARPVDVTLTCTTESDRVYIQIEPGNSAIEELLGSAYVGTDGQIKKFATGLTREEAIKLVGRSYERLYGVIQKNKALLVALSGNPKITTSNIGAPLIKESDEQALLAELFGVGADLYRRLFIDNAEPSLFDLINKLESSKKVLRIRIETDGLYIPWQLLHAPGSLEDGQFWGFNYELSVNPLGKSKTAYKGPLDYRNGPLLFVQYRGDTHDDEVASLGQMQAKSLQTDFKFANVVPVNSRDAVLTALKTQRSTVQMLVAYTHASSGTVVHDDGHGQILVSEDPAGPKLLFTSTEALPARDLSEVSRTVAARVVFDSAPLVILNGCETGTAGFYATTNLDFPGAFLVMGARGVLATEAPVWNLFAYNFAISLMHRVTGGEPIPVALFNTRLEYLHQNRNPLGLLYSYYGGPDVTLTVNAPTTTGTGQQ